MRAPDVDRDRSPTDPDEIPTECRRFADDSPQTVPLLLHSHARTPEPPPASHSAHCGYPRRVARARVGRVRHARPEALASTCLTGSRQRRRPQNEPEVAWWESFGDPVLSDLIRRAARENRDVKIAAERVRAARAGETISRSWLLPSIGVGAGGFDHTDQTTTPSIKQAVPEREHCERRHRRLRGKSTSPVACARAQRRPRPTRSRSRTARAACACWC